MSKQGTLNSFFGVRKPKQQSFQKRGLKENEENSSEKKPVDAKRRRAILDDSDDDEPLMMQVEETSKEAKPEEVPVEKPVEVKKVVETTKKAPVVATTSKPSTAAPTDEDRIANAKLADARALLKTTADIPSNAKLLKDAPDLSYNTLCKVFSEIEAVTGRLVIQQHLTTLLRRCLLLEPQQTLGPLLYLASNQVAPAYDCVELGIGDAILMRAIAEATGTSQIKQKYEATGDLGTVAQSCKSKQRTLAFAPKKKTKLGVDQVLQVFREIAETKGNQAQKQKVDKIKKLLVQATDGMETKYIIRGLQGKLRIGLAQSTVLISLAHAVALTPPVEQEVGDTTGFPDEALQYLDSSLPTEKRLEAAVAIVKKAYSEVPSYDALIEATFSAPLHLWHQKCTLQPGIPVVPMLAKPTKSIQEVLSRLNGMRFTVEYKYDGGRCPWRKRFDFVVYISLTHAPIRTRTGTSAS